MAAVKRETQSIGRFSQGARGCRKLRIRVDQQPKGIWALARGNANPNAFLPATAGPARAVAIFEMKLEE